MVREMVIRRENISNRKKTLVFLCWGVISLILLMSANFQFITFRTTVVGSVLFGVGVLIGLKIGRDTEYFDTDIPNKTI